MTFDCRRWEPGFCEYLSQFYEPGYGRYRLRILITCSTRCAQDRLIRLLLAAVEHTGKYTVSMCIAISACGSNPDPVNIYAIWTNLASLYIAFESFLLGLRSASNVSSMNVCLLKIAHDIWLQEVRTRIVRISEPILRTWVRSIQASNRHYLLY